MNEQIVARDFSVSGYIRKMMEEASPDRSAQIGRIITLSENMSQMNGDLIPAINRAGSDKESGIVIFKRQNL